MVSWSDILAATQSARERAIIVRLSHHAAVLGLTPGFTEADRDRLLAYLQTIIADGRALLNDGLAVLRLHVARANLDIVVCQSFPTLTQQKRAAEIEHLGVPFEDSIEAFVRDVSRPVDRHGRGRAVFKSHAEKYPAALRHAARICIDAELPPTTVRDLLAPACVQAIIAHYGDETKPSGGRSAMLSTLKGVARGLGVPTAVAAIGQQRRALAKPRHAVPQKARVKLSRYHSISHRDRMLRNLSAVTLELAKDWPQDAALRRVQAALALLLAYFLVATPEVIYSLVFDVSDRAGRDGDRPRLMARLAPHEPLERRLPKKLIAVLDLYWTRMPADLRSGEFFVIDAGDNKGGRLPKSAVVRRLQMLIAELEADLTPLGFVGLAILDMAWDSKMTDAQMALAARFGSTRSFLMRYRVLLDSVQTMKAKAKGRPQ